jgi:RNA-directed DNA polymerase
LPRHLIHDDGHYRDARRGMCLRRAPRRRCPLSPLLGALYLGALDQRLAALGLFYTRFMDDWVALAPTRRKLRRAIKVVNRTLNELKLGKHIPTRPLSAALSAAWTFWATDFRPEG